MYKEIEMPEPGQTPVLIVGAGPTGLLLAVWLTKLGVPVRIVDSKPGLSQETRAIVVHARTMEFYDQLGLGQEALARGLGRYIDHVSVWNSHRLLTRVQISNAGSHISPHPYFYILPQDQNEAMLLAHLEALGGAVEWQTELAGFTQDQGGVTATLRHGDHTETVRAAYLAGCDGAHSGVRHGAGIAFSGETYDQTFYVVDATVHGTMVEGGLAVRFDGDNFLLVIPMPEAHRYRIVGQVQNGAGKETTFETVRPAIEAHGQAKVEQVHWFATYRVHHRVADQFRRGRAFLLGDAGHVHSPVGGQGMNTGLGDAANLAWKLAHALHTGDDTVLATYERERRPFAVTLVNTTDRAFSSIVHPSAWARFIRTVVLAGVLPLASKLNVMNRLFFRFASQTRIHYSHSPLSIGQAGTLRSGDRLPWVPQTTGSNFDALQSLGWQVHVYGQAAPELHAWCERHELPLHVFPWTRTAQRAGLAANALYLVRPDGYVALALPHVDYAALDAYALRWLPIGAATNVHSKPVPVLAT